MPVFSVVIPLYNKEQYIRETLQSALDQTFADFEIIIVNDGSTDNSAGVVKLFTDTRIHYIEIKNSGVSAARNTAIKAAKGSIIAFLDADDLWQPNHLEALHELYLENPTAGMLCSRYITRIGNGVLQKPVFLGIDENFSGIIADAFYSSTVNRVALTAALAIPKRVFGVTGMFNENTTHPEDTELWIKIMIQFPIAITNQYTVIYNFDQPQSWSRASMESRKIMDFSQFKEYEKTNKSLKAFVDIYRIEYALKYRIEGDVLNYRRLLADAETKNLSFKTKLLFITPPFILQRLLAVKHWLHRKGVSFSVYN